MNKFESVFSRKHTLLPVIHTLSADQALRNAETAFCGGADGIFLINHNIPSHIFFSICRQVRQHFPTTWIGINCLDCATRLIFSKVSEEFPSADGIWVDDIGISGISPNLREAQLTDEVRKKNAWDGLYFAGVAFKGQQHIRLEDLPRVTSEASNYTDVVTTSGIQTGTAPDVEKIKTMHEVLRELPLAIASGITPENVRHYLPYANCFLVATGICEDFFTINPRRLKTLRNEIDYYGA